MLKKTVSRYLIPDSGRVLAWDPIGTVHRLIDYIEATMVESHCLPSMFKSQPQRLKSEFGNKKDLDLWKYK
jgi:hypothetical protein